MIEPFLTLSILLQTDVQSPSQFNEFLLLAYAAMWLVFVVYLANLANKQRNVRQEIRLMQRLLEEDEGENGA